MKRHSYQFRTPRRHLTTKEKAEILSEHRRSGLSLLAFARKEGLCYASLLRWRCRQGNGTDIVAPPHPEGDPRFVPVSIQAEAVSGDYVLSWPSGRSLKIPRRFDTDCLRRLLSVLEEEQRRQLRTKNEKLLGAAGASCFPASSAYTIC